MPGKRSLYVYTYIHVHLYIHTIQQCICIYTSYNTKRTHTHVQPRHICKLILIYTMYIRYYINRCMIHPPWPRPSAASRWVLAGWTIPRTHKTGLGQAQGDADNN